MLLPRRWIVRANDAEVPLTLDEEIERGVVGMGHTKDVVETSTALVVGSQGLPVPVDNRGVGSEIVDLKPGMDLLTSGK